MSPYVIIIGIVAAGLGSLFFSTLTYSLREFSRARLAEVLEQRGREKRLDRIVDNASDWVFVTAVIRLLCNALILIGCLRLFHGIYEQLWTQYILALVTTWLITLVLSVAVPHAMAQHAAEGVIAMCYPLLDVLGMVFKPLTKVMHAVENLVRRAAGGNEANGSDQIEQEILSVVEEGEKEGVVAEDEREMIESVIEFRNTQAAQIMTPRPEIVGLEIHATLKHVQQVIEESGNSRIPVYEGTLDHVLGVLYARDLLRHLWDGGAGDFDIRKVMRPAFFVPETKLLRDLLKDFRLQKVHMAIVLDEYGGTAGLVTIEDILEELVGEISDEHEPSEPAMLRRIDDLNYEADARIYIEELNRVIGLSLPEDAGYDTLGGFVSTTLGRIPETGTVFEQAGVKYEIIDAEPQKVNRVKITLALQPAVGEDE